MMRLLKKPGRWRKYVFTLAFAVVVLVFSGCQTFSYYSQAIKGQYQIFTRQESVEKVSAAPETPPELKQRLELVRELRVFAQEKLKLPVDGHYRKYVDVHRPCVVWNVQAAPEFSLQPKTWWYPLVGSLEYRGYFSEAGARKYGQKLRGYDVYIGGVQAYSTLGWFKDPLLNTFIFNPDADLAETLFHELGHQRVFARGDTDFNEAFATTVGEEGARRWLQARGDNAAVDRYLTQLQRNRQFVQLIMKTREQLETVYGDERSEEGKLKATRKNEHVPAEELRQRKQQVLDQMQRQYADLKKEWGEGDYDGWFARQVNNAQLNSVAAYYDLLPGFERLLALDGGDLQKFYGTVERLSKKPKKERQQWLRSLGREPIAMKK